MSKGLRGLAFPRCTLSGEDQDFAGFCCDAVKLREIRATDRSAAPVLPRITDGHARAHDVAGARRGLPQ